MSLRRAHQKSKLGCVTCKKRRVKCDQGRPDCKNCSKRGLECSFRTFDPAPRSSSISPPGNGKVVSPFHVFRHTYKSVHCSPLIPSVPDIFSQTGLLDDFPDILRPRLKQLLHHFATETSATISHNEECRVAWCAAIPTLASSHRFVLQGVFAISSLHLSRCVSLEKERKSLHNLAAAQMNTGLFHYRNAIENITVENAEALFAFAVTTQSFVLLATADECSDLLQSTRSGGQAPDERSIAVSGLVSAISKVMRCLRGVLVILVPCWEQISNGILSSVAKRDWWPHPIPTTSKAVEEDRQLGQLEKLWAQPSRRYEYWFDVLIQALKKLRENFALVSQLTPRNDPNVNAENGHISDWTSIMVWPTQISSEFINLLEQQKPEAWVILAHYAILRARIANVWWAQDLAPNIVSTAALVIGEDMWHWIEWPATVVGVNLKNLQPGVTDKVKVAT